MLWQCWAAPKPTSLSGGAPPWRVVAHSSPGSVPVAAARVALSSADSRRSLGSLCSLVLRYFSPPLTHFSKLQGLSVRSTSPWAGKRGTELCSLEQAPDFLSSVKT